MLRIVLGCWSCVVKSGSQSASSGCEIPICMYSAESEECVRCDIAPRMARAIPITAVLQLSASCPPKFVVVQAGGFFLFPSPP